MTETRNTTHTTARQQPPPETIHITTEGRGAFHAALAGANPGDKIVYHIDQHCGGPHRKDAMSASDSGKCFLFCQRVGPAMFQYIAVKR